MYIVLYTKKLLNSLDTKEEDYFFFFHYGVGHTPGHVQY